MLTSGLKYHSKPGPVRSAFQGDRRPNLARLVGMQANQSAQPITRTIAILGIAGLLGGCGTFNLLTDNCTSEAIIVSWPATITRGGATTNLALSGAVTPGNLDPARFNTLKQALITGGSGLTGSVVWTVPAFEVNGGYIALMHKAPLGSGQTEPVNFATDAGGWGFLPSNRDQAASIAVRADNFTATSASGSITAIDGAPLRLRIDVTTQNSTGETMRLTGDAQFRYSETRTSCS